MGNTVDQERVQELVNELHRQRYQLQRVYANQAFRKAQCAYLEGDIDTAAVIAVLDEQNETLGGILKERMPARYRG